MNQVTTGDKDEEEDGDFLWVREEAPFLDFDVAGVGTLRIHQNLSGSSTLGLGSSEGLHTTVWEAAVALYLFVLREEQSDRGCWRGKRVLELGAGTGLVGLTLAALGAEVVLTELSAALPLLRANVEANKEVVLTKDVGSTRTSAMPVVCHLEWGAFSSQVPSVSGFLFVRQCTIRYEVALATSGKFSSPGVKQTADSYIPKQLNCFWLF